MKPVNRRDHRELRENQDIKTMPNVLAAYIAVPVIYFSLRDQPRFLR